MLQDSAPATRCERSRPQPLRARLQCYGFVRVNGTRPFAADRYVIPVQTVEASGDRVILRATQDEMIKHWGRTLSHRPACSELSPLLYRRRASGQS